MARAGFSCAHCGAKMQWQPGASLHCGKDCEEEHAQAIAATIEDLTLRGFVRDQHAPNIWVKDFVAVTIEQVLQEGIDAVIESHSSVVREINVDGVRPAGSA